MYPITGNGPRFSGFGATYSSMAFCLAASTWRLSSDALWSLSVDHATQTYRLFINGEEVKEVAFSKGAGRFEGSEIPEVFESLSFGWNNYQQAGKGFVAWIDDIALAKDRLGARGIVLKRKP